MYRVPYRLPCTQITVVCGLRRDMGETHGEITTRTANQAAERAPMLKPSSTPRARRNSERDNVHAKLEETVGNPNLEPVACTRNLRL